MEMGIDEISVFDGYISNVTRNCNVEVKNIQLTLQETRESEVCFISNTFKKY